MNKHNGFSFILFPIIILVIGALSFTGWYVWSKNYRTETSQIETVTEEPRFCGQRIWTSETSWKVTCIVSVIFDDPIPTEAQIEEIIKPVNGEISTAYKGIPNLGIYNIKVELGQEESAGAYLQSIPGIIEAKQYVDSQADIN